jgi:hypothetical protein
MPCQQPPRVCHAGSRRGQAVPAAAAGRPCRQPPLAGPAAVGRRAPARPLAASAVPGCAGRGARRELHLLPPANPDRGRRWEWHCGTGEWRLRYLSHPRHVRSRTFRHMHGPQPAGHGPGHPHCGSVERVRAEGRACALSGARARGGARGGAHMGGLCVRAERRTEGARGSTVHARGATLSVSRALRASTMP